MPVEQASNTEMSTLHLFTASQEEWVVAHDPEDARDVYCEVVGSKPHEGDPERADPGVHEAHWAQVPDDRSMTLRLECDHPHKPGAPCIEPDCRGGVTVRRADALDWAIESGRGYFGSARD
jgi:hypothetical protein